MKGRVIRIPASIGNVGPGFDTLGLAVSLYLRVSVRRRIDDGIVTAFQLQPFRTKRPPSLEVDVASDIPECQPPPSAATTLPP